MEKKPFSEPAISLAPRAWLRELKGQTIAATHAHVVRSQSAPDPVKTAETFFGGNPIIGSSISGGTAVPIRFSQIHPDGFGRLLVCDHKMTPRQSGRLVQRLFEIDTYRMMALLWPCLLHANCRRSSPLRARLLEITAAMQTAVRRKSRNSLTVDAA